ncbi:MAG: 4Fe-4S binding protein [Thermodesulfovibrio sp.]|uniref:4Fe-4S binding protein n=1 Tax=unclassified Thermodesulfovibrio TaxID=2645936 RepID=UPI00083A58D5|nr:MULTISPECIES: 4Fe-4S binding protein [unclassified Thermodesulfovibrio]MDI1472140.1 4Fe-4S binding protein [Thermodesulfovibrio sp. 1176]MDI6715233.1 4Fe-4S binding protein [Thermodesulfovibrio sp.]ODA45110.1 CoB--CoM heterodisulfide reductase subunit A [Thermodesulfovibrio sp. N1]
MSIGVIFCSCAGQITEKISFEKLKELINNQVEWIENFNLACSEESQKDLIEFLIQRKPNGLIIIGCSSNNKGSFFNTIAQRSGVNKYMINFVNIREQVAWVTEDKNRATKKAYALFKGALERLKKQKPLSDLEFPVLSDILVVGGGIAGITASINLSKAGYRVHLIEKDYSLGGKIVRYEKLFPDLTCAPCFVNPMIEDILNSEVEVRLNGELKELKGFFGNLFANIISKPTYVNPKKCIGCSACEDVCPAKAIKVEPMRLPAIAKIDTEKCLRIKGQECDSCITACPVSGTINFNDREREENLNIGAVLLSTGFSLIDCRKFPNLGYGIFKNVYNALDFEEILNSEGPTKGEIITEFGETPKKIGIIHCVGSLDEEYYPYCSKICCQYAFKFNCMIRQTIPDVEILHFVREIVLPGKNAYNLYLNAKKDKNVKIIRYESIKDLTVNKEESLSILYKNEKIPCDIIILCPAIIQQSSKFEEINGVFLTGSAKEAMTVEEAVTDSLSICSRLMTELKVNKKIIKSPTIARIDYNICTNCGICVLQCPYKAIELNINEIKIIDSICEGCGTCVPSCPSKAIELEGFTYDQIVSEMEGILSSLRRLDNGSYCI